MELPLFTNDKVVLLNDPSGKIVLHRGFDLNNNPLQTDVLTTFELQQESIFLFGKSVLQPRLSSFFGDKGVSYIYSNRKFEASSWNPFLKGLSKRVRELGFQMNSALVNYYRDGNDSMGLHADNEPELGQNPTIVSVNYGASRRMAFKKNVTKETLKVELKHGDLLVMSGELQHHWKHELPKQKKVSSARLNITFRKIIQ